MRVSDTKKGKKSELEDTAIETKQQKLTNTKQGGKKILKHREDNFKHSGETAVDQTKMQLSKWS